VNVHCFLFPVYSSAMKSPTSRCSIRLALALVLALPACGGSRQEPAAGATAADPPTAILPTSRLTGQSVAILPITLVVADPALESDSAYATFRNRRVALEQTDSLVSTTLTSRAPEVNWVPPRELRKMARRSAGYLADPDQMGQAMLRGTKIDVIPDPLRSSLRSLMAVAGGRVALVPAALGFGPEADGTIRADLSLVLADARSGKVMWRSVALGRGKTPHEALSAAMAAVLPLSGGQ
jgi:hypothetical protein